jgi:hypothetical protein
MSTSQQSAFLTIAKGSFGTILLVLAELIVQKRNYWILFVKLLIKSVKY